MKIIVADDERDYAASFGPMFKRRGYLDVKFILTPEEAIVTIKADKPDVVVLDVNFENEIDGFEVLRQTKAECPKTQFIMSSAYTEYQKKALDMGAYAYLLKPLEVRDLFALIKTIEDNLVK